MRKFRRAPGIALATLVAAFACAQFFPATSSSFTNNTTNGGNTVTAAADWTAPAISAAVLQKAEGGVVNKITPSGTFYLYASVADSGNPASGVGTLTASTSNIATVASATLTTTGGPYTVGGTSYNYRSALLTAKSTLSTTTYTYTLSVSDTAGNGPTTSSPTISASTASFAPSSFLTSNVTGTSGKADAGDTITFTYSSAPDPESLFAGWNGTSRTVSVVLADKSLYGTTSDIIGIVDGSGNTTSLGYLTTGGDFANAGKLITYATSTIALSGSTYTVTLSAPGVAGDLHSDTGSHAAVWSSYATAFDTFGADSSAASITGVSRKQF